MGGYTQAHRKASYQRIHLLKPNLSCFLVDVNRVFMLFNLRIPKRYASIFLGLSFFLGSLNAQPGSGGYNVKNFGAKGDGLTIDSESINQAIKEAAASGGGTIYFPAGRYRCYSIRLMSNISLYLDQGCVIEAADSLGGGTYDAPEPGPGNRFQDFGHSHWHNSLIWGENLENISILGPGMIDGKHISRGFNKNERWEKMGIDARPFMWNGGANKAIALKLCKNVILKDFTILKGGHFGILATGVDNMTISNLKIDTNRDGIDIDCCRNVRVSDCTINSPNDDALCLKSSYALGFSRATENVTITNCQVSGYDVGTMLDGSYQTLMGKNVPDQEGPTGRIKFGTESNGGFKNITISNCIFDHCRGLALETVDGGLLEDVTITNLTMRDLTNSPFFLRLGARMRGPEGVPVGKLRRINISNVNVYGADSHYSSIISGLENNPIEDLRMSQISIWYKAMDSLAKPQEVVPEHEKAYPEPQKFGIIPSYGFFIRHVKNLEMSDIEVHYLGKETRPAMILDDVSGVNLQDVRLMKVPGVPTIKATKVTDLSIRQSQGLTDVQNHSTSQQAF